MTDIPLQHITIFAPDGTVAAMVQIPGSWLPEWVTELADNLRKSLLPGYRLDYAGQGHVKLI